MKTKISRWGNSLALRLPRKLAASHNLEEGSAVEIIEDSGELKLRPLKEVKFGLNDLLAGVTDENRHGEVKTGSPVGKESW
jgi:antitoxin MazE